MNENESKSTKTAKSFGYRLGQALALVTVLCLMTLMIGITVAILFRIF